MSCKTSTSIARSLSPSNESHFVPHSSVVEPSSVMEGHFTASDQSEKADGDEFRGGEASGVETAASNANQYSKKERTLSADEEKSGIVGATICFTPEPSPARSTCNLEEIGAVESNGYAGLDASGLSEVEGKRCKTESSEMHFASSLDGKSTTEYEILESISSTFKGTIEVEDLISDSEEDEKATKEKKESKSERNINQHSLSPCSTLPSLGDTPFKIFKTHQPNAIKTPHLPDEDRSIASTNSEAHCISGGNEENIPILPNMAAETSLKMPKNPLLEKKKAPQVHENEETNPEEAEGGDTCFRISHKLDLEAEDSSADKSKKNNFPSTSSKVDEKPLTPLKHLHKYWEGKGVIGRIFSTETPAGVDFDENEGTKANIRKEVDANETLKGRSEFKSPTRIEPISEEKPFSLEKGMQPPDIHVDEPFSAGQVVISKPSALFLKVMDALSGIAGFLVYFIVSASIPIVMFLYGQISSVLCIVKMLFGRSLLHKVGGMITRDAIQVDQAASNEVDKAAVSSEDLAEHSGTNISKLFSDEALKESGKLGLDEESARQSETEEPKEGINDYDFTALEPAEKVFSRKINGKVNASIITKCKKALSSLKAINVRYAIALCALVSIILVWTCMLQHDIEAIQAIQVSSIDGQEEPTVVQSLQRDDPRCYSTHLTNFVSIPLWEFNLSPTSFESFEEEPAVVQSLGEDVLYCFVARSTTFVSIPPWEFNLSPTSFETQEEEMLGESSYCLSSFVILSIALSLLCALIFKSKICFPFIKRKSPPMILTGIWSEEEHQQFIQGYNVHGSRWKLVSTFIPTRTETQVKTHGRYWLKVRSPATMKKTRNVAHTPPYTRNPSKKKNTETPSSVSHSGSTPRKSNKANFVPLKGILIEKDSNQLNKNVTPRSALRERRMKTKAQEGSQSDPGKRVRIQSP